MLLNCAKYLNKMKSIIVTCYKWLKVKQVIKKKLYSLSYEHVFFFQIHMLRPLWKMIITYDVTHDVTSSPPPPTTTTEQEHIITY